VPLPDSALGTGYDGRMPSLGPIVVVMWVGAVGVLAGGPSGSGGLIGGAVLGLAGVVFLQSLYPIEPPAAPGLRSDGLEGLRYRLEGNGLGALPWVLAAGSTILTALAAGAAHALPLDTVAAVVAVLGAGLWAALGQVEPWVEVSVGVHTLSIRRGWVRLGAPRVLSWDEVGCAVLSTGERSADAELVVAGADGPLIRTGLCASPEDLTPLVEEIEAQLARRVPQSLAGSLGRVDGLDGGGERAALERLLQGVSRSRAAGRTG
jgi:hypothetical protein